MQFSVGYFPRCASVIAPLREKIAEVYFAFGGFPNGRASSGEGGASFQAQQQQLDELKSLGTMPMNLLLNGTCYGKYALSRALYQKIGDTVDFLCSELPLQSVTTTSPLIARFVKENFPALKTRASVNMSIGDVCGMEYVADLFDEFYASRDRNRDLAALTQMRSWCSANGKKLFGLANSGCLLHCSAHAFHDNLVSHENEAMELDNAYAFEGQCRVYLKGHREAWIAHTTWIRPEDVPLYEGVFDGMKLATRVHADPGRVIRAYTAGRYSGSLPGLLEPDHTALFYPHVIENARLPQDFGTTVLHCSHDCSSCGYCGRMQEQATVNLG